jgi:hypothetical protein
MIHKTLEGKVCSTSTSTAQSRRSKTCHLRGALSTPAGLMIYQNAVLTGSHPSVAVKPVELQPGFETEVMSLKPV